MIVDCAYYQDGLRQGENSVPLEEAAALRGQGGFVWLGLFDADRWMAHVDDHVLAFNDLHCAFAAARSPDPGDVKRFSRSLDAYERLGSGDNRQVTAEVGRRLIDGAFAFAGGDYARAIEAILPVRYEAVRIGGSHAQRDIVNLTLIAAAERSGQWRLARALLAERAGVRPTLPTFAALARAQSRAGAH